MKKKCFDFYSLLNPSGYCQGVRHIRFETSGPSIGAAVRRTLDCPVFVIVSILYLLLLVYDEQINGPEQTKITVKGTDILFLSHFTHPQDF